MHDPVRVTVIIPIRHVSQRIQGKNYRILGNKPLYRHILETLIESRKITNIIIDTNSSIVKEGCEHWRSKSEKVKKKLNIWDRPEELSSENLSVNVLIRRILDDKRLPSTDIFLHTHVTNPFLTIQTIEAAINTFLEGFRNNNCDSLISVNQLLTRLYNAEKQPINHYPKNLVQTQKLPHIYEDNS